VVASAPPPQVWSPLATPPPAPAPIPVDIVLDADALGETETGFVMGRIEEGLLVVRNMPAAAFLVTKEGAITRLPDLFKGLHSPVKELEALDFAVNDIQGSLRDLSFSMDVPSTGEVREVRGRAGAWKVTKPKQPAWVAQEVVATPIRTKKGAQLYERAPQYQGEAREGFSFVFDGPSKGEALPIPAPGKNGCKYRLLGHPLLAPLPDGSLLGVGTECTSGGDTISTGKLDGLGWPYQTLLPRIGEGHLAVERWKNGTSTVDLLPGADQVAQFANFDISVGSENDVAVLCQIATDKGPRVYVAHFDGRSWSNISPPDPPEWLAPYRPTRGVLHLFAPSGSLRRTLSGWDPIRLALDGEEDPCREQGIYGFAEAEAGGAVFLRSFGCVWKLAAGASLAQRVELSTASNGIVQFMAPLGEWLYLLAYDQGKGALMRLHI